MSRGKRPNSHAVATGQRIKHIMSSNPGIKPQQAMAMASKQTAMTKGRGLYLMPSPHIGKGLYMGRGITRK